MEVRDRVWESLSEKEKDFVVNMLSIGGAAIMYVTEDGYWLVALFDRESIEGALQEIDEAFGNAKKGLVWAARAKEMRGDDITMETIQMNREKYLHEGRDKLREFLTGGIKVCGVRLGGG